MNRKRISRLLIFAGILAGLFGSYALLVLFLMSRSYGWHGTLELLLGNGTSAQIQSVCLGSCVAFLPYYPALGLYFRICLRIGKNQSFHRKNGKDLEKIALWLAGAGGLWFLLCGVMALVWRVNIGPTYLLAAALGVASAAVAIVAYGLSRLICYAVDLQEENDLTI